MKQYMMNCVEQLRDDKDELDDILSGIDDIQDNWDEALDDIQKKIIEKAVEFGITREEMDQFTDLELREMYVSETGIFCYACKNFHKCYKNHKAIQFPSG